MPIQIDLTQVDILPALKDGEDVNATFRLMSFGSESKIP